MLKRFIPLIFPALLARAYASDVTVHLPVQSATEVVLTRDDLDRLNPRDANDVLNALGITARASGGYGSPSFVQSRSFTENCTKVIIDGVDVASDLTSSFDLSLIDWSAVESVRFTESPYSEDGAPSSSGGGVLYIETQKSSPVRSLSYGSSVTSYLGGDTATAYDWLNGSPVISSDGSIVRKWYVADDKVFPLDGVNFNFSTVQPVTDKAWLSTGASFTDAHNQWYTLERRGWSKTEPSQTDSATLHFDVNVPLWGGLLSFRNRFTDANRVNRQQRDFEAVDGVSYNNSDLIGGLAFDGYAGHTYSLLEWADDSQDYVSGHATSSWQVQGTLRKDWERATLSFTASQRNTDADSTDISFSFVNTGYLKAVLSVKALDTDLFSDHITVTASLPEQFSWYRSSSVNDGLSGSDRWLPSAGLRVDEELLDLTATADAYSLFRAPDFEELFWTSSGYHGNPDLLPESGHGWEVSLRKGLSFDSLSGSVFGSYYRNWYKDSIHWAQVDGVWKPANVASAVYQGTSLRAELSLASGLWFNLGWHWDWNDIDGEDSARIMWTPEHTFSLVLGYDRALSTGAVFHARGDAVWVTGRFSDNAGVASVDPYLDLSATMSLDIPGTRSLHRMGYSEQAMVTPFVSVRNALSQCYQRYLGETSPTRSFEVGFRCCF